MTLRKKNLPARQSKTITEPARTRSWPPEEGDLALALGLFEPPKSGQSPSLGPKTGHDVPDEVALMQ